MYKWRKSCVDFQNNLKAKLEKYSSVTKAIKKKLKEERDQGINATHPAFQQYRTNFEHQIVEGEKIILSIFTKVYQDYKDLRDTLEGFAQFPGPHSEQILKDEKWAKLSERDYEEELKTCSEHIETLEKAFDHISKIRTSYETQIMQFYKSVNKFVTEVGIIQNEKFKQISDDIDKMEKDFSYLLNPTLLPASYQASLAEVNRRRDFCAVYEKTLRKLQCIIDIEKEARKRFLAQHGRILPSEFIPQLKNMPPSIIVENPDNDAGLPKIEGIIKADEMKDDDKSADKTYIEELEKLNKEYKQEIQKLREDSDIKSLKKKLDDCLKEFEQERERNKALKLKLAEAEREKERLASSVRRDPSRDGSRNESDYESLKNEFENLSKLAFSSLSSLENQENMIPNLEHKNSRDGQTVERLTQRVGFLTALLTQTTKSSLDIFFKKLNEKQKKYDESKAHLESIAKKAEEELQIEKKRYEDRIRELERRNGPLQDEIKRYQKEIHDLKAQISDKEKFFSNELENLRKNAKVQADLLKSKDEIIRSLTDIKNAQAKEIAENKEKMERFEQKIKLEHSDVLTNIHNLHKAEIEKLRTKIKNLENDISNKNIEIEKISHSCGQAEKDARLKEEHINKLNGTIDSLNKKISKLNEDLHSYKNKIDNMEITIQNKTAEIATLTKQVNELTVEKCTLNDDLSKYIQFNNEMNKRVQAMNEAAKKVEAEKSSLKSENEKLNLELEKKKVEINNLKEQIDKINAEKKQQIEELTKITENHETERMRIAELNEEINQKNIQLNTLKTKYDILSLDLENKLKENETLLERNTILKLENEKLVCDVERAEQGLSNEKARVKELEKQIKDIKIVNEQLVIEGEIKAQKCSDVEKNLKSAYEKIVNAEDKIASLEKELENVRRQSHDSASQQNEVEAELKQRISKLEEEIREKNEEINARNAEIETLTSQLNKANEDLNKIRDEKEKAESFLKEKEETLKNMELDHIQTQNLLKELEAQENSYKEDVKIKQQEIQDLRDANASLNETLEKLRAEISELNSQLSSEKMNLTLSLQKKKTELLSKIDYLK